MSDAGGQRLRVPDVGVGNGPFPSVAWIPGRLRRVFGLGLSTVANESDKVVLLGAIDTNDPISEANENQLGTYYGPGVDNADLYGGVFAWPWFAVLRYPPNPVALENGAPAPTTGLTFDLVGENGDSSLTSFAWQITLVGGVATSCAPPAWAVGHNYTVLGTVVAFPNGAYGRLDTAGISGATAPQPGSYESGYVDGGAVWTVTGPEGFTRQFSFTNSTGATLYTSGSPGLTATTGFAIGTGGAQQPPTQPAGTYLFSAGGGLITLQGWP